MEEALTTRLLDAGPVAAIFGDKVHWGIAPQGTPLPYLILTKITPGREYTHDGADATGNPRTQFSAYGNTAAEALAGLTAVRDLIEAPGIVGPVEFTPAIQASERGPIDEDLGGGRKAKRYDWDFFVWFTPAA